MAKRAVSRSVIALTLLSFVLAATGVIARRSYGIVQARRVQELDRRRAALAAERLRLEAAIRDASSRGRLAPVAEQQLQMQVASPEQLILLPRPRPGPPPHPVRP
jgi:cell division protein FtsL